MRITSNNTRIELSREEDAALSREAMMADINLGNMTVEDVAKNYDLTPLDAQKAVDDARTWAQEVDIYHDIAKIRMANGIPNTLYRG